MIWHLSIGFFLLTNQGKLLTKHNTRYNVFFIRDYLGWALNSKSQNCQFSHISFISFYCNIVRKNVSCDLGLKLLSRLIQRRGTNLKQPQTRGRKRKLYAIKWIMGVREWFSVWRIDLPSISSTLYIRVFCTNVVSAAFSTYK